MSNKVHIKVLEVKPRYSVISGGLLGELNAYALADGRICVTYRLEEALTERQLDGVISHEVRHLNHHHLHTNRVWDILYSILVAAILVRTPKGKRMKKYMTMWGVNLLLRPWLPNWIKELDADHMEKDLRPHFVEALEIIENENIHLNRFAELLTHPPLAIRKFFLRLR